MTGIPRYRRHDGPALLSAGFRPFFLGAAVWAAIAIPLWLIVFAGGEALPSDLPALVWHVHEMVFGYGAAVVAGFLLTAIPNWTGRMPLQGSPLLALVLLWLAGRAAVLSSAAIGPAAAAVIDLAFPLAFLGVVAREILKGRNWRNLPMVAALLSLFVGNLLVHLGALGFADAADLGNRLGIATLLMLISLVGGRIIPSFTRNWLARERPQEAVPAPFDMFDRIALAATLVALALWVAAPYSRATAAAALVAGAALLIRLARWQGTATLGEPLLVVLHLGYFWLGLGLALLGFVRFAPGLSQTAALHTLTIGAIGTMTLAVMSRASLGHTGRPLKAGPLTIAIYVLVTAAAILRVLAPLAGTGHMATIELSGAAWSGAFGLFALAYAPVWTLPRVTGSACPI
jgi:uncharacterized protein involved in response to NO